MLGIDRLAKLKWLTQPNYPNKMDERILLIEIYGKHLISSYV